MKIIYSTSKLRLGLIQNLVGWTICLLLKQTISASKLSSVIKACWWCMRTVFSWEWLSKIAIIGFTCLGRTACLALREWTWSVWLVWVLFFVLLIRHIVYLINWFLFNISIIMIIFLLVQKIILILNTIFFVVLRFEHLLFCFDVIYILLIHV